MIQFDEHMFQMGWWKTTNWNIFRSIWCRIFWPTIYPPKVQPAASVGSKKSGVKCAQAAGQWESRGLSQHQWWLEAAWDGIWKFQPLRFVKFPSTWVSPKNSNPVAFERMVVSYDVFQVVVFYSWLICFFGFAGCLRQFCFGDGVV